MDTLPDNTFFGEGAGVGPAGADAGASVGAGVAATVVVVVVESQLQCDDRRRVESVESVDQLDLSTSSSSLPVELVELEPVGGEVVLEGGGVVEVVVVELEGISTLTLAPVVVVVVGSHVQPVGVTTTEE